MVPGVVQLLLVPTILYHVLAGSGSPGILNPTDPLVSVINMIDDFIRVSAWVTVSNQEGMVRWPRSFEVGSNNITESDSEHIEQDLDGQEL